MGLTRAAAILCCALLVACGGPSTDTEQAAAPAAAAPSPAPAAPPPAALSRTPAPAGARAYIIAPENGATVTSPVRVVFGLQGIGVVPAGIERPDAGHHHLLVDTGLPPLDLPIPADAQHVHFGGGQTETELELSPGTHSLQLLLGDHLHIPHDPAIMSERVTIVVE